MLHPLEQKLAALRRHVRPMAMLRGVCVAATALAIAASSAAALDYVVQFEQRGLRVAAWLLVLAVWAWAVCRHVLMPLGRRWDDGELAVRVQRRFPALGDRLLSAVEFLHGAEDDPAAGSIALRRAVIAQTTAEAEPLDFSAVVDRRPTVRAVAVMIVVYLPILFLTLLNPAASSIAVVRLAYPWGSAAWPQATHLMVRRPVERLARGQNFQVEVVDAQGARLPSEVRIHYRLQRADGGTIEETQRMRFAAGAMTAERENVQRPFAYRITGGDDRTSIPWTDVEVVEPPAVASLSVRLTPPAYTGWPAKTSEPGIRALVGTRAAMTGRASKPLAGAKLCFDDGWKLPGRVDPDGNRFAAEFVVGASGAYWWELTDREGFSSSGGASGDDDRWEIQAVADAPPTVRIEQPAGNVFVAPRAVVPIRVAACDDLALREVTLKHRCGATGPESSVSLYSGPARPPQSSAPQPGGDGRVVEYRWNLAPLKLRPGTEVTFYATADDYRPQSGKSDLRRLTVVTPDQLQDRIADREKFIAAELERALKMQQGCRGQVETLQRQVETLRHEPIGLQRFKHADADRLQAVENAQRDVRRLLTSRTEGVPMHVLSLAADLENNRLDDADAGRRMASLLEDLDRLGRETLPPLGRALAAAAKTAQVDLDGRGKPGTAAASVAQSLSDAAARQDDVIALLKRLAAELGRLTGFRRLHREVGQLLRDQEDATQRTQTIGRRTIGREPEDLAPRDAAELKAAAATQLEIARLLDRALQQADRDVAELRKTDPAAADTVADALEAARRAATSGRMRSAGAEIERNRIGQAAAGQKQIAEDLQQMLDTLSERRPKADEPRRPDAQLFAEQMAQLRDSVKHLHRQQQGALAESQRLCEIETSQGRLTRSQTLSVQDLARLQRSLETDAARLARRLGSGGAFGLALDGAAAAMREAADSLDQRRVGPPTQQPQRRATGRLGLLVDALKPDAPAEQPGGGAGAGNNAEPQGQQSGLHSIAELKLLKLLQQQLNVEVETLQQAVAAAGKPTDAQRRQYAELSERQGALADAATRLAQPDPAGPNADPPPDVQPHAEKGDSPHLPGFAQMGTVPFFRLADENEAKWKRELGAAAEKEKTHPLVEIARQMRTAQERLGRADSGADTQKMQQRIVDDLDRLIRQTRRQCAGQCASGAKPSPQKSGPCNKPPSGAKPTGAARSAAAASASDASQRRARIQRLWGALPQRAREQMAQGPVEDFVPKYQSQIEDYFRRLSETKPAK
jgi:hypothetical protein